MDRCGSGGRDERCVDVEDESMGGCGVGGRRGREVEQNEMCAVTPIVSLYDLTCFKKCIETPLHPKLTPLLTTLYFYLLRECE